MFLKKNNSINFKRLWSATFLVIGLTVLGFVFLDTAIQPFFRLFDFAIWRIFNSFLEWQILAILSLVIFGIAAFIHKKKLVKSFGNAFFAIILAVSVAFILNFVIGRMRPVIFDALGKTGFTPFSMSDIWHSFPAVHIAAVFGMLVSIGLVYPRLKPFLYTFSVLAGVARICMGDYFPTDVLFGAFIGMVSADIVVALRKKLKNQ